MKPLLGKPLLGKPLLGLVRFLARRVPAAAPIPDNPELALRQALDVGHNRLIVAGALLSLCFLVIAVRLVDVTLVDRGDDRAAGPAPTGTALHTERADIVDRNGVQLATSLPTVSLYAVPEDVLDPGEAARSLAAVLPDLSESEILTRLTAERGFVWLKRNLTPRQEYVVNALGIPGLYFRDGEKRVYPLGALAAHAVGFTDIDNHGLGGVEKSLDQRLRTNNEPLRLTIDVRVQDIVRQELQKQVAEFHAAAATGLVMDVRTGELLAMVSLPDFDPNDPGGASADSRFNRASLGVYEMGSVFKTFTLAMALDKGTTSLTGGYDASQPIHIARFTIHDDHPKNRWLSVPEIYMYSSNIGAAKMALDVGTETQKDYLRRLGMLRPVSIELPEVGRPLYPASWHEINTLTIGFGHGIAVSPLHVVMGVGAVVNGGVLRAPTLIKMPDDQAPEGTRVLSERTSRQMCQLMRLVVQDGGTGEKAQAPGYMIGGKTGTAEKEVGGHYLRNTNISSFIGAFPLNDPRYAVYVVVDSPHGTKASHGFVTAGWVAAPVFGRIVSRIGPLLGIQPVDESDPKLQLPMTLQVALPQKPAPLERKVVERKLVERKVASF